MLNPSSPSARRKKISIAELAFSGDYSVEAIDTLIKESLVTAKASGHHEGYSRAINEESNRVKVFRCGHPVECVKYDDIGSEYCGWCDEKHET